MRQTRPIVGAPRRGATLSRRICDKRDPNGNSRRICDKCAPQRGTADKHPRVIRGKGAPRRFAPPTIARKGAFDANAPTTFTTTSENVFLSMLANKTPRQRSRSTSPRRDPKRRSSRRVCAKRDPQSITADKHSRVIRSKVAPRRCAPLTVTHMGAFDANAPTTFTALPKGVYLSMFASKTPRQRSRSTSPRRDPKRRSSRRVCAKRDPSEAIRR